MTDSLYSNLIETNLDNNKTFLILDDGSEITYKDFIILASKISHKLSKLGLKAGSHILVKSAKCKETLALYLSSILTGSVFFPLNTSYTVNETIYFIKDSKPSFLICDKSEIDSLKPICDEIGCRILSLNANGVGEITDGLENLDSFFEPSKRTYNDLAALLYTSGTTGKPKGAMLTEQNLVSNAQELINLWNINRNDTLIHSLPIYHTHGLFVAINTSMISGATIRFIKNFNTDSIIEAFNYSTLMMGVPTFYTRLLNDKRLDKKLTQNMRLFISGSAPLLNQTFKNFYRVTGHQILERYGMTETNMNASNPCDGERKAGSVGKPLKDIKIRINNIQSDNNKSKNDIGIIEINGPNVFKGYLNNPKKTQEAFTKDGFFITGDIGYFDNDGYLFISGRNKDLIISGGYNFYPKEIEDIINQHELVLQSAVFGIPNDDLGEVPIAAIVMKNNSTDLNDLKDFLKKNEKISSEWSPLNVLSVDAGTVGNLDLDIIDRNNKLLDEVKENKFEIIYLFGQDNLGFKKKDEFIIYQGSHGDRGAEIADIILPGAAYTEQSGHYTNLEGKIQKAYKASYPPGDAKEDWQIINDLAEVMNNRKLFNDKEELESSMFNYLKIKQEQKNSDFIEKIEQKTFENYGFQTRCCFL